MPALLIPFLAGTAVGAYVFNRFTGAVTDAGNAVVKIAAVGGIAYLGFEVWKRGGFK